MQMILMGWCLVKPELVCSPCPAEWIKKPRLFLIFSQSDYLIQIVDINLHT